MKRMSVAEAVAEIRPHDTISVPLGPGQPGSFMHGLATRVDYEELEIYTALLLDFYEIFTRPEVTCLNGFFGPVERMLIDAGHDVQFVPSDFRRFAPILQRRSARVVATVATPPDRYGDMSLSLHSGANVAEIEAAAADPERLLIVEVNPKFPRTYGLAPEHRHAIHVDVADIIIEGDRPPLDLADPEPSATDRIIAENACRYIHDGCTLQTGIGGIPSMVVKYLAEGDGGDYGVHSEMFTTGLMYLHKAGKVTNNKGIFNGISVTTFSAGTAELYEWLDGNETVRFLPVDVVNSPELIARNRRMVTLNGALAVDLWGQVVADTIGDRQYSGIGGHEDFVSAPGFDVEARSLVCLPATASVGGELKSRIVPRLPEGWVVTTPRHQVDVVVTEFGSAELRGRTVAERAEALAAIAHPDFRAELFEQIDRIYRSGRRGS